MFAFAVYFAISTASLFGLMQLLSTRNENCVCGKCDEHYQHWLKLQTTISQLSPLRYLAFWLIVLILALPLVVMITYYLVVDLVSGGTDSSI